VLNQSVINLNRVVDKCIFNINFNTFHLPDYILTEKQKDKFVDKETLFEYLIEKGLRNKVNENVRDIYRERVEKELKVIKMGEKLIDYFLILWDIIQWCHNNDILVGVGRGSSAGCLVSYLLDIVQVDPIKYNLLFERFLNENRIGKKVDCEKIILQTIEGDIELWHDKKVLVLRGDIELNLKASEIKEKDKIIEIY